KEVVTPSLDDVTTYLSCGCNLARAPLVVGGSCSKTLPRARSPAETCDDLDHFDTGHDGANDVRTAGRCSDFDHVKRRHARAVGARRACNSGRGFGADRDDRQYAGVRRALLESRRAADLVSPEELSREIRRPRRARES